MENIWLVIPTYNEAANLPELTARLFALPQNLNVLVVDDASPDGTGAVADELAQRYPRLHVLHRAGKLGLGSAYRAGFAWALARGADVVGEMDADLSHAPEDVPRLLATIHHGAGAAIGSRRVAGGRIVGWGMWRSTISWGAAIVSRLILGLKTKDVTAGFRLYTKAALAAIPWQEVASDGYAWQEELVYMLERAGVKITEVPVTFVDRTRGHSKLNFQNVVEFFVTIWRLRSQRRPDANT